MTIHLHQDDLPDDFDPGKAVAIDSETTGLHPGRDRLCLVQVSSGDGDAHLVKVGKEIAPAPNLTRILADEKVLKLYHYARFDIAMLFDSYGVMSAPNYCTKIASRLVRTYTDRHSLKTLCQELLGVSLSKEQQSSDWAAEELTKEQMGYAASDVLYLHQLCERLNEMLEREGRLDLALSCFDFLPTRCQLDLAGWPEVDIFSHS
ncbi:MAG: ribonuclease D [Alphaproteobacteria bacterium]|nr:ribonuclease D [Alphaproteobacteria bacterium SS10]